MQNIRSLRVLLDGKERKFDGRYAWCLQRLLEAGERGCTPIECPAPRWSHYVFWLRGEGVAIDTINEKHGGPYAGTHARYVLRSAIQVIEMREAA